MTDTELRTDDLAALQKTLKGLDRELGKVVPKMLRKFATEAKRRADREGQSLGGVHAHVVRRGAIKAFGRQDRSGIRLASKSVGPAAGAEYGAKAFPQFPRWRGNRFTVQPTDTVGYMIHPALRDFLPDAEERFLDELLEAIADAIGATQ